MGGGLFCFVLLIEKETACFQRGEPNVGADSISARGVCGAAGSGGVRAPRPTSARRVMTVPFGRAFAMICRGGIYPSRGHLRRGGVPGTISGLRAGPCGPVGLRNAPAGAVQASSPTEVCYNAGTRFPGWPPCFPCSVGRAFTPAAPWQFQNWGLGITARSGGVRAPRPTSARVVIAVPVGPKHKIYS